MDKYVFKALREELYQKLAVLLLGEKIPLDIIDAATGEILVMASRKITKTYLLRVATCELKSEGIEVDPSPIRNRLRQVFAEFEHEKKIKLSPLLNEKTSWGGLPWP